MTSRKRVSLTVQVDVDSEETREEVLHAVTVLVYGALGEKHGLVRQSVNGVADFIPSDEQLTELGVGGGSHGS